MCRECEESFRFEKGGADAKAEIERQKRAGLLSAGNDPVAMNGALCTAKDENGRYSLSLHLDSAKAMAILDVREYIERALDEFSNSGRVDGASYRIDAEGEITEAETYGKGIPGGGQA